LNNCRRHFVAQFCVLCITGLPLIEKQYVLLIKLSHEVISPDRLCGLVVRVLGYRSGGPGSIPGTIRKQKKVVGLVRGPLSLVSTTEELLDIKVAAPV
jgi:hypothetical protein